MSFNLSNSSIVNVESLLLINLISSDFSAVGFSSSNSTILILKVSQILSIVYPVGVDLHCSIFLTASIDNPIASPNFSGVNPCSFLNFLMLLQSICLYPMYLRLMYIVML